MKDWIKTILGVLICAAFFIGMIELILKGGGCTEPEPKIKTVIVTKDSIVYLPSLPVKEYVYLDDTVLKDSLKKLQALLESKEEEPPEDWDTIPPKVCNYLARQYFSTFSFDSLLVDTDELTASVEFKVTQNKVFDFSFPYSLQSKQTIIYKEPKPEKIRVWLGGGGNKYGGFLEGDVELVKKRVKLNYGYHLSGYHNFSVGYRLW